MMLWLTPVLETLLLSRRGETERREGEGREERAREGGREEV